MKNWSWMFLKKILLRYSNWEPNECTYTVQVYTNMKIIGSIDTTCLTYTWSLWPLFKYIALIQPVEQKKWMIYFKHAKALTIVHHFTYFFWSHKWSRVIDNFFKEKGTWFSVLVWVWKISKENLHQYRTLVLPKWYICSTAAYFY